LAGYIETTFRKTPYVWGGEDPSGADCSGVIRRGLYAMRGLRLSGYDDIVSLGRRNPIFMGEVDWLGRTLRCEHGRTVWCHVSTRRNDVLYIHSENAKLFGLFPTSRFGHWGVVYRENGNGWLDPFDTVIEMRPGGLRLAPFVLFVLVARRPLEIEVYRF
jgi:hypothetical protein